MNTCLFQITFGFLWFMDLPSTSVLLQCMRFFSLKPWNSGFTKSCDSRSFKASLGGTESPARRAGASTLQCPLSTAAQEHPCNSNKARREGLPTPQGFAEGRFNIFLGLLYSVVSRKIFSALLLLPGSPRAAWG